VIHSSSLKKYPLGFTLLLLSACAPAVTPAPTQTPVIISECFPHRRVQVWYDTNGDRIRNADEPAAAGVSVAMYSPGSPGRAFLAQTGPEGLADLYGIGDFGRYCDDLMIEITAPREYAAPTPAPVDLSGFPADQIVEFPLVPLNPTASP
jgi:hypothetical protein